MYRVPRCVVYLSGEQLRGRTETGRAAGPGAGLAALLVRADRPGGPGGERALLVTAVQSAELPLWRGRQVGTGGERQGHPGPVTVQYSTQRTVE